MAKLRLVKMIVHPIFVIDDGETLREFQNGPSEISAADWPDWPEKLKLDIAEVEKQLGEDA